MKTIIHVNQHVLKRNRKTGERKPPITVKTYKNNLYCKTLQILDKDGNPTLTLKYSPEKPLKCGAVLWIESESKVKVLT